MIPSIRVRLTKGPFDGETHELYAFCIETPPDQIEFVVLDEIGIPNLSVDTAKYIRSGEPVKVKGVTILPYLYLDLNPQPKEIPHPESTQELYPPCVIEAEHVTLASGAEVICPFEPGSFHQYPLILDGRAQKIVYRVLGHLPGYWKPK